MKRCPDRGRDLPDEAFPRNRSTRWGRASYCKECHNQRNRASKARHGGARNYHLRRRYGLTAADVDALRARQDGLCAVCRRRAAEHVDHDHETGIVRGMLCLGCNGGLGHFGDDPARLGHALAYLGGAR